MSQKPLLEGTRQTAFLLIGDRGLSFAPPKDYKRKDLAEIFFKITQLPLPFAVVAYKKNSVPFSIQHLCASTLEKGLDWSFHHQERLKPFIHQGATLTYWKNLSYKFNEKFKEAIAFMKKEVLPYALH